MTSMTSAGSSEPNGADGHDVPASPAATKKFLSGGRRRFAKNIPGVIGLAVIIVFLLVAMFGPLFTLDPNRTNLLDALTDSGIAGTDPLGRDVFARVVEGARVALFVSFVATALGMLMAMVLGITAGYFGGMVDEILSRIFDVILTFPMILLGVLIVMAIGPSILTVSIAIAIAIMPRLGRQFRAQTLSCVQREYVQAVRAQGYSSIRIILRHVLPNVWLPVTVLAAGNMGKVAVSEASLSYLGAGVEAPNASWGNMISEGQAYLQVDAGIVLWPGFALLFLAIAFSFVGDALRDAYDLTE
ncbi:MAG: peptide transporter permease [Rhodoglobus sp.]|nr:peptide transporter permease [Rhodoglobus sp.]